MIICPCPIFGLGINLSHFGPFVLYQNLHVSYRVFGVMVQKQKNELLYWDIHDYYREKI